MSTPASAENTMKILEYKINDSNNNDSNNNDSNNNDSNNNDNNSKCENENKIFFKSTLNDSDDDDMVVIILEEDAQNNDSNETESYEPEKEDGDCDNCSDNAAAVGGAAVGGAAVGGAAVGGDANVHVNIDTEEKEEKGVNVSPPKQKYIGVEVYTHLQQTLESQKMYPLLPCNMISSFARVMEYVEYFDIPGEERKKLVVDLVKILAYSNNDYGSRDCFEYFVEHNMIDDIIKTIVDSTKNRYDINRFPHTNRKIVLSCVSLSNKIKIAKPNVKIESLFEELKVNLCGLKRFFRMNEKKKDGSKQT
jgi:hypothetical protein